MEVTQETENPTKRSRIEITPFTSNIENTERIRSPFVIHTTTKEISNFLSRLSHMLKTITFQINTSQDIPFLEIRVIHASKTCAVHGLFYGESIEILEKEQPLITVDTKELLCNTSMKIHSSPCQIYYDSVLSKIVLKTVCDRARMQLYTPTLTTEDDELPNLNFDDDNNYCIKLPLFIFKASLKLALQKKIAKIDFFLGETNDNQLAFGMLFDEQNKSHIFIPVMQTENEEQLCFNDKELCTFPSSIREYKTQMVLSSFSVEYINKFLSSLINTGAKSITLKLHKDADKPLKMIYNDIVFMLSPLVEDDM